MSAFGGKADIENRCAQFKGNSFVRNEVRERLIFHLVTLQCVTARDRFTFLFLNDVSGTTSGTGGEFHL